MTQDEVDLIYDYLHENYKYVDGELIAIKDISSKQKIGSMAGHFWSSRKTGKPIVILSIPFRVLGKKLSLSVAHCIYLYHYKVKTKFIAHLDGNPTNTEIENLIGEQKRNLCYRTKNYINPPEGITKGKLKCGEIFDVKSERNGIHIHIGRYLNKEMAKKSYEYLRELLSNHDLNIKEIKKMVLEKFPVPYKKTNKLGFIGIRKYGEKYLAYITIKNKKINLGRFESAEEAHQAYLKAKEELKNER